MGALVQATDGNLVLGVPRVGGGVATFWRDNGVPEQPWYGPSIAFGSRGDIGGTALVQDVWGVFHVLASEGNRLVHARRERAGLLRWRDRSFLAGEVAVGCGPAMVPSATGGLEVVAPLAGGGMGHWYRDDSGWNGPYGFGSGPVVAVGLASSGDGTLDVVARSGDTLRHWWRDGGGAWHASSVVAAGALGHHDLLIGGQGDRHVLAPLAGGGVGHWSRAAGGDDAWHGPAPVGDGGGSATAAALAEHPSGALEAVVRAGERLEHWWRDLSGAWHGPTPFGPVAPDPRTAGDCTVAFDTGVVGIHAVLLRTGKVLLFAFSDFSDGHGESRILDPSTGTTARPLNAHAHLFCSGHAVDGVGRVLVAGGHHADIAKVHTFHPDVEAWQQAPRAMRRGRWYPTCTTLPDGQVLAMSGTTLDGPVSPTNPVNDTVQVVGPSGPQEERTIPSPFSARFPRSRPTIDLYPFVFVLPSGALFVHSRNVTRFYDPRDDRWSDEEVVAGHPFSRTYPGEGTAVLLALRPEEGYWPRVLVAGGGGDDPERLGQDTEATASAELLDLDAAPLEWQEVGPMQFPRVMPDAVLLPDGTVAVIGGSARGLADHAVDPVMPVELFDPATRSFRTICSIHAPRLYHSTALLLPDATVLVAGKDGVFNDDPYNYPERRGEILRPPYLCNGGTRPVIDDLPAQIGYGSPFSVVTAQARDVSSAVLVRPGSVTHSFNMDQRLVELELTSRRTGRVELKGPPTRNIAPPGHHLLFLVSSRGVPSVGRFVHLT
jgi:hypothetical protein